MITVEHLPALNAILNSIAFTLLILGYIAIKKGRRETHIKLMCSAFVVSTLFLTSYLIRHYYAGSTPFPGDGILKVIYFVILIPHIILAAGMVPLILMTFFHGLKGNWEKHKKMAKITFPIWSYVSITGVIIYLMLYQLNKLLELYRFS